MAFVKHVRNVLLNGRFTEPLVNCATSVRAVSTQRGVFSNLWIFNENKIVYESRQFWGCLSFLCRSYARNAENNNSPSQRSSEIKQDLVGRSYTNPFNPALVEKLLNDMNGDIPISTMPDPFEKEYRRCFICRYNIQADYKNVRLLSQFVSPYTGRIYGRAITGLCIPMQKHIANLIKRSRRSGYMSSLLKDSKYIQDPQPYDAMAKKDY